VLLLHFFYGFNAGDEGWRRVRSVLLSAISALS
jgi:hypothetical protein